MFRTIPLSIIRSISLHTQQWYMSYGFADSLRARSGRNQFRPDLACITSSARKRFLALSTSTFLTAALRCFHLTFYTITRFFWNKFALLKLVKYTESFSCLVSYIDSTLPLCPKKMTMELLPKFLSTSIVLSIIICSSPIFLINKWHSLS